jgi:hypothetical protein
VIDVQHYIHNGRKKTKVKKKKRRVPSCGTSLRGGSESEYKEEA